MTASLRSPGGPYRALQWSHRRRAHHRNNASWCCEGSNPRMGRRRVASIKLIDSTAAGGISFRPNGQFTATNVTLRRLILIAFGLPEYQLQLTSLPSWNISTRFQVLAKDGEPSPPDAAAQRGETRLNKMLQNLLVERFKLAVHHETRELPVYELVKARADGRLGPQFRPSNGDCDAVIAARAAARASGVAEPPPPPRPENDRPAPKQVWVASWVKERPFPTSRTC